MVRHVVGLACCALLVLVGAACAGDMASDESSSGASAADGGMAGRCYGANDCPGGYTCNELGHCSPLSEGDIASDGGSSLPPEVEQQHEPPASGKLYVYVALPAQDLVAKIHSQTLQVRAITVGKDPGALQTIPQQDVALVLNRRAATATVIRSRDDGGDDLTTLETASNLNRIELAPNGQHALAFYDATRESEGSATPNFQELSLLRLQAGHETAINLSVGFRPSAVRYSADSARAFVVTEQGISKIELAKVSKPAIMPTIPVLKDPLQEPKPSEVLITPDGALALLRRPGLNGLRVVDLASKAMSDLALGGEPTDLDLTPDGKLAIAVLREAHDVALIDIPEDLGNPAGIDHLPTGGYLAGQAELTHDGARAYLFSNATEQEVLLVADLRSRSLTAYPLKKGVRAVYSAPDDRTAVVIHNKVPGEPRLEDGVESYLDRSYGYSLVNLEARFDKLVVTEADPGELAFAPDAQTAYLLLADATRDLRLLEAADLSAFLVKQVPLGSQPLSLGVLAATKTVYIAQSHPLGRMTFLDMQSQATKTVTGFELNSYVIE